MNDYDEYSRTLTLITFPPMAPDQLGWYLDSPSNPLIGW